MRSQGDNVSRDGTPGDHGVTESEMSAHKDAAALVTTIAAQTETIRQLSARLDQLENRMKGTPCEGAVQQLVGDAGALLQKRPRPSSSDDDESSSDDSVADCAQLSISCRGCQVQGELQRC